MDSRFLILEVESPAKVIYLLTNTRGRLGSRWSFEVTKELGGCMYFATCMYSRVIFHETCLCSKDIYKNGKSLENTPLGAEPGFEPGACHILVVPPIKEEG